MNNLTQDKEIKQNETAVNYYYGSYINYKAFKDYHIKFNLDDSYLTPGHCMLLAFMVDKYYKDSKMPHIKKNGSRYVLMNTNFIKNNLIYLNVKERTIKYYISMFNKLGLIDIEIRNKNNRYIYINDDLIILCYEKHWTLKPINYLIDNRPELWNAFVNEWKPYFPNEEAFKKHIDDFNDTRLIEELNYNTKEIYEHLINSTKFKLFGKVNKQGLRVG